MFGEYMLCEYISTMRRKRVPPNAHPVLSETSPVSPEVIEELKRLLISDIIDARHANNVPQTKLHEVSGVVQPCIQRLESGETDPKLTTLIKLLLPLNKTLAVVSLRTKPTV